MRIILVLSFTMLNLLSYGQNIDSIDYKKEVNLKTQPTYIFVIDTMKITFDSIPVNDIRPKWIKKIEVFKDENSKSLYGNQFGIVVIYPKRRFYNRIMNVLKP